MREYKASAVINAPPERVWAILQDAASYPEWDPTCERIEGRLAIGEKIKVYSKLSPGRAFPVKVTEMTATHKMVWQGGMPLGLFKGVRTFLLTAPDSDSTRIVVKEVMSGPMLLLIGGSIPDLNGPFQQFLAGLKARAESS